MNAFDANTRGVVANLCGGIGLTGHAQLSINQLAQCTTLRAEIAALTAARACACDGDATTIYARIDGLISECRTSLQQLQQGGGL